MADKPRILIIGDAVAPTGFARVIRGIFDPLANDYQIHQLATRYNGGPHSVPWTLYRADAGNSVYGYDQVLPVIKKVQPQIVFLLYDLVFQAKYMEILRNAQPRPDVVIYSPVEAGPVAPELMQQLHGVSRYVMYTEYGRREIAQSLDLVRARDPSFSFPALSVIPHGVDTDRFYPLDDQPEDHRTIPRRRLLARQRLGMDDDEHLNAFIVLNANRNMPRKRIDITMQGFARFAEGKPAGVKLYLHMATEDTGWNVVLLARRYQIYDRLIMTQADNTTPTFCDQQLNDLYNACDVGLTTTTGEGWGMVSFEHAATRSAQVLPRHTSLEDLWQGSAAFLEPAYTMTYPGNLTVGHYVTPEAVASALDHLYRDHDYRRQLADAAYDNATQPQYRWPSIANRWDRLFRELAMQHDPP